MKMINQLDPKHRQTLSEIQGNILKNHGREHTANIFIVGKPNRQTQIKNWLNELVDDKTGIIKSGYEQLYANHLWKTQKIDGGMFACIHISADGYVYFSDKATEKEKHDDVSKKFQKHAAFVAGLKGRKTELNDPDILAWDEGYQNEIHFHLLIADASPAIIKDKADSIKKNIESFAEVVHIELGDAIKNAEGAGIEHFGYVDGISQPLFFEDEMRKFRNDHAEFGKLHYDPSADMKLVLVEDPFSKTAQGSFFVFRKLEQNVKGFKKAEEALADELGLKGEDKERAGAMIVGRFEDGTPVEVSGEPGMIGNGFYNNFNYDSGDISKCPFHAHIRKTNPRKEFPNSKNAVMARRGITYGKRNDDIFDGNIDTKPTRDVGLLFQSYQASIEAQFETIQRFWANNEGFIQGEVGLDLIIGQGNYPSINEYQTEWNGQDDTKKKKASFEQFVTMKGGGYFFAPSIEFLKSIK